MERKRIVHTLDTPYSAVEWPLISQEDQDTILELLCHLLTPLGTHRKSFITPSKGKRKRSQEKKPSEAEAEPAPPVPELAAYVDVGLTKITRTLQDAAASAASSSSPYSVVFVARTGQSPAFNCLYPQMVGVTAAQTQQPPEKAVRLVGFSKACAEKLSEALGIPRVSSIALKEDAPHAKGLVGFVREHVPLVQVEWLKEVRSAKFLETKIDAVPTKVGTTNKNKKQKT
ncbi:hypothetical protein QBC44DRAFT_347959 [Cladorrhinum sp. PSN332]|nr:hypothetical protein QBC44DRAFT_347959 [Cladorrhinum sp. PSN332]